MSANALMARGHAALLVACAHLTAIPASAALAQTSEEAPVLLPDTFELNDPTRSVGIRARAEIGALAVARHRIRYGTEGTEVDYRRDADQDTLFPFLRLSAELEIRRRHALIFLYQPLAFVTESVIDRDLRVGEVVFPEGTLTRFVYGFDFYRLSYQFDIFADRRRELAFGAGIQLRNARILFASADGTLGFSQTNLGPVPTLRARGRYLFESGVFIEGELEGIVTPVPGRAEGRRAIGALLDASFRAGLALTRSVETFLGLRYLGGGFRDPAGEVPGLGEDEATSNFLHTLILFLGLGLR